MLQCGDPSGDGTGGPGYSYGPVENAPADGVYPAGTIAMARSRERSTATAASSSSSTRTRRCPDDAGGYTVIGTVTSGLDELRAGVTDAGTSDGAPDGAPAVPTTITAFTIE